ncbi:MAG: cytochrome C [Deltaproteobacteria bacterium CG11_big_fil_rev_8_21_14_0_20_47_16]|nr:MAG: cytochrome C [Deltaproteobacteria bacterium CG11_big_fil_rev_8_21_14_0_20_47_16]
MTVKMMFGLFVLCGLFVVSVACSKSGDGSAQSAPAVNEMGVGPIQSKVTMEPINSALVAQGKRVFEEKCSACHKFGERYVGPDLKGVTLRRKPEWIMNMILNPQEMTQQDATAKELLATYMTQMTFQNVSQDDARAILEYFRQNDSQ